MHRIAGLAVSCSESATSRIVIAARPRIERRTSLLAEFDRLDAIVARRTLEVFGTPEAAAEWLMLPALSALPSGMPVEVANTPEGRTQVLHVLDAIERGVFI